MEDPAVVATEILEPLQDMIFQGLTSTQVEQAREGLIKWLQSRIQDYQGRSPEERERQVQEYLPRELTDMFSGLNGTERFNAAVTALDQLRLRTLDHRIYERAQAFLEGGGNVEQLKADAEADLRELRTIEDAFQNQFPDVYRTNQRIISESKLDCFYVLRNGGAASRRLGRQIQRMKSNEA